MALKQTSNLIQGMVLMQLNVRGINKTHKFNKLKIMISKIPYKIDIIILSETKLLSQFPSKLYQLNGFNQHICCRDSKNAGGGLLIFVNKNITTYNIKSTSTTFEKITFNVKNGQRTLKFINVYRAPDRNNLNDFMQDLESELCSKEDSIILAGDININAHDDSVDSKSYRNVLKSFDMIVTNTHPTRNASQKTIDHLACSNDMESSIQNHTICIDANFNDHNMILSVIKDIKIKNPKILKVVRRTNYYKLKDEFQKLSNEAFYDLQDPNTIAENITTMTQNAIKNSTTTFKFHTRQNNQTCEWLSFQTMKLLERKQKIIHKIKKSKKKIPYQLATHKLKSNLKLISIKLRKRLKNDERKSYASLCNETNSKKLWRNINTILGRSKDNSIRAVFNDEGNIETNDQKMANLYNDNFISSITSIVNESPVSSNKIEFEPVMQEMFLDDVDEEEIATIIKGLKNSSPGIDGICPSIVKHLALELCPLLCHMIRRIYHTSIYPKCFKTALVIPINKSGNKTSLNDYRPVAMLTIFNKIVEKTLYRKIYDFVFFKAKIMSPNQFGFRAKSGTETAALELIEEIRSMLDNKKKVSAVFMDIRKAFDLVNIDCLLHTLDLSGIRENSLNLIESYLRSRKQIVKINAEKSKEKNIEYGVVQGGILGSLLFIIFFNHITSLNTTGKLFLYADDAVLINNHEKQERIEDKIIPDLNHILKFFEEQQLHLNFEKTNFMIFHSPFMKIKDCDLINIGNSAIKRVECMKYLGLLLDEHLKWDRHCGALESKLASISGILWKLKSKLPQVTKKLIYHTLFESHLNYMSIIYGTACDKVISPIQKIQNRALRNVFGIDFRENRVNMYAHLVQNCLPVRTINFISSATFIFNNLLSKIHSNIVFARVLARTRNAGDLRKSQSKSNYGKKRISSFGASIYNYIPQDYKNLPHMHAFKWALKCYIRNERMMSLFLSGDFLKELGS